MLVLARKANEAIQIGANITITVLRVKGKTVKLGIEAPGSVAVLRAELLLRCDAPAAASGALPAPSDRTRAGAAESPTRKAPGALDATCSALAWPGQNNHRIVPRGAHHLGCTRRLAGLERQAELSVAQSPRCW